MTSKTRALVGSLVFAAMAASGSMAFAEDKTPGSGPNPYTDCGIGAALFKETQWAAVTSNITWDLGTTALISGTMSPQTCSGKQVKVALFIRDTQPQLAEEVASGSGEHLTAVLNLAECGTSRHTQAVAALRATMAKEVSTTGYQQQDGITKSTVLYRAVESAVNNSCSI